MTDIYVRALHTPDSHLVFLATRLDPAPDGAHATFMAIWNATSDEWTAVDFDTPGLATFRAHHLERALKVMDSMPVLP
jgi:hypothetical protein